MNSTTHAKQKSNNAVVHAFDPCEYVRAHGSTYTNTKTPLLELRLPHLASIALGDFDSPGSVPTSPMSNTSFVDGSLRKPTTYSNPRSCC